MFVFSQWYLLHWPYLGNVFPIGIKWKRSVSVWYWVNYETSILDLFHDLDFVSFKVKYWNSCISAILGLIDMELNWNTCIWVPGRLWGLARWPYPWPWPWIVMVKAQNSFISGMYIHFGKHRSTESEIGRNLRRIIDGIINQAAEYFLIA